ncbi:MAG: hypothetical protein M3063_05310 [Actinomycetota bacterium]|nr:hypothetical protein [Actinomycetota bacterium]
MRRRLLVGLVITLLGASCSSSSTSSPPDPSDVQAAKACEAFSKFLSQKATGGDIIKATRPLLAGSTEAQASSVPGPKWADLGANLINAAGDANTGDTVDLANKGNIIAAECGSIPGPAKQAGGYVR